MTRKKWVSAVSDIKKVINARDQLLARAQTLLVAVSSEAGVPEMGSSPFWRDEAGCFYIYTSELARHVRSLIKGHKAQFLLITDEQASQNIWARVRIHFDADTEVIDRNSAHFAKVAEEMTAQLGATMALIIQFRDFHMIKITPKKGLLVTGFAAAYDVEGTGFDIKEQVTRS